MTRKYHSHTLSFCLLLFCHFSITGRIFLVSGLSVIVENLIRLTVITKPKRHVDDLWNLTNSVNVLYSNKING